MIWPHTRVLPACPSGYGTSFTKTEGHYVLGFNIAMVTVLDWPACEQECVNTAGCVSIEFDAFMSECTLGSVTKFGHEGGWIADPFLDYWQRNCA